MRKYFTVLIVFILFTCSCSNDKPVLKIGLVADPQYAEQPNWGNRHYSESLIKLKAAIDTFNLEKVDFVQNLGDIIDTERSSFDSILPVYRNLKPEIENYHTLGNHDYSIDSLYKNEILEILSMPDFYYSYIREGWRFIVLDATDMAFFSYSVHGYRLEEVEACFNEAEAASNQYKWNSGIGSKQQAWLKNEINSAELSNQRVIIFSHLPLKPLEKAHNLWNNHEIIEIIEESSNVFAYFNGHNHAGTLVYDNGIHYITMNGMVESKENSFGILEIYKDRIILRGYGNQPDLMLSYK